MPLPLKFLKSKLEKERLLTKNKANLIFQMFFLWIKYVLLNCIVLDQIQRLGLDCEIDIQRTIQVL